MGRPNRVDYPGAVHHVTNRGVRGMDIYPTKTERKTYLELIDEYSSQYRIDVLGWCLMPNHFHLLLQSRDGRLSSFMATLQSSYAMWFNHQRDEEPGRLFQARFFSEIIETDEYFNAALHYVLTNPHRSNYCGQDQLIHPWTSTIELSEDNNLPAVTNWSETFELLNNVSEHSFEQFVKEGFGTKSQFSNNRRRVRDLRVVGSDKFLESLLDRTAQDVRSSGRDQGPVGTDEILKSVAKAWELDEPDQLIELDYSESKSDSRYVAFYLLRVRGQKSVKDIAELFGLSKGAVSQGIKKLKERPLNKKTRLLLDQWDVEI